MQVRRWSLCSGAAMSRGSSGWQSWTPSSTCLACRQVLQSTPLLDCPPSKLFFSGLFSFKINVFRLSSFKIKMFRMSSFKIKKNDCPPSRSKSFGLSSFKGGVVGEELITALGCTEPVDGRRGKSHPWKVSDHLTSIKHIISALLVSFKCWHYWSDP